MLYPRCQIFDLAPYLHNMFVWTLSRFPWYWNYFSTHCSMLPMHTRIENSTFAVKYISLSNYVSNNNLMNIEWHQQIQYLLPILLSVVVCLCNILKFAPIYNEKRRWLLIARGCIVFLCNEIGNRYFKFCNSQKWKTSAGIVIYLLSFICNIPYCMQDVTISIILYS